MPASPIPADPNPLRRPFPVDRLHRDGIETVTVEASEAERAALAGIDGLVSVDRLVGRFELQREHGSGVKISGEIEADVMQTCIVSLDPFAAHIHETILMHFVPQADAEAAQAKAFRDSDEDDIPDFSDVDDVPDPIVDGTIDLGMIAAEFLALSLDPYPRKPGATFEPLAVPDDEADAKVSPFSVLQSLKDGNETP